MLWLIKVPMMLLLTIPGHAATSRSTRPTDGFAHDGRTIAIVACRPPPAPTRDQGPPSDLAGELSTTLRPAAPYKGFEHENLYVQVSEDQEAENEGGSEDATLSHQNALRSAEQYLETSAFSEAGLIEQLSSEAGSKFTAAQAEYAANKVGLC